MYRRKSVRSYTGENVTDEQLKLILKAAYASPVGRGRFESLLLTVVQDKDYLDRLDKASAESFGTPDAHPLYNAPTMIIISSNFTPALSTNVNYSNAAIVAEHISLAATELGIGSCLVWGAIRVLNASPALLKELSLPEGFTPCCSVILGKTEDEMPLREIPDEKIKTVFKK